jgi:neopullulanase
MNGSKRHDFASTSYEKSWYAAIMIDDPAMNAVTTPAWVQDATFYQIFPDSFARSSRVSKPGNVQPWHSLPGAHGYKGGDLWGIVEKLDYLYDLGINALYLCPIFQSASNHRYHTHDYYRVDPMLGGDAAFRELLDRAHDRDIHVIIDGVFNHASRGFFQFNDILENGLASAYADWFVIKDPTRPLNAYDARAMAKGKATWPTNYRCWWDLPALPEFNTDNPEVRQFLWDVAAHWVEFGIDGWRLDVPECIDDPPFWQEFRRRVKQVNPEAYIVGEIWHPAAEWLAGDRFDAVMNYVFNRAAQCFFGGPDLDTNAEPGGFTLEPIQARAFARRIEQMVNLYDWQITLAQLNLLGSHDTPRILSILGENKARLDLCVLFQMTMPGAPCIYYGDEIGMSSVPIKGHESRATMSWDDRSDWNLDLRQRFKEYIALRKAHPALRRGKFATLYASDTHQVYAFLRHVEQETIAVILNNSERPYPVHVPVRDKLLDDVRLEDLLGSGTYRVHRGHITGGTMTAHTGIVLRVIHQ